MGYKENLTQEERILKLLEERGSEGAYVYEFMTPRNRGGLGIAQYSARIWGLRQKGHNIVNKKKGFFVLTKPENEISNEGRQHKGDNRKTRNEGDKSKMHGGVREVTHQQPVEVQPEEIRQAVMF